MTIQHERATPADFINSRVDDTLARMPGLTRRVTIAGISARLTFDDRIADSIFEPFSHLDPRADDTAEALRVFVAAIDADSAEALRLDELPESGTVDVWHDGETVAHFQRDSVAVLDRTRGTIRALMCDPRMRESWKRAKPLQLPLSVFFADRGIDLLHGGLVSLGGTGVLLAGAGGSGKSTVALASLLTGLDFLGDDCVAMKETSGRFEGYSVFGSGCLERAHLASFPLLGDGHLDNPRGKAVLPAARLFGGQMAPSTTIRGIVLPHVTGGSRVSIRPASGKETLLALAPSSILKRAMPAGPALARMARMVRSLPAYHLDMGPVDEIGPRVRDLLLELAP